jgi:hypothetical protein
MSAQMLWALSRIDAKNKKIPLETMRRLQLAIEFALVGWLTCCFGRGGVSARVRNMFF